MSTELFWFLLATRLCGCYTDTDFPISLDYISGYHRPFPLTEYDISYPHTRDIVSIPVLIVVALIAPAIIILLLSLLLPSGQHVESLQASKWRAALWRAHVGWLGLATGLATTLFITSGLKDLVGKPRPDLLDRCNADTGAIQQYLVGGLIITDAEPLVSSGICRQPDTRFLDDGFAAFPSGHSSFSCAGLVYLSLWLSARLSIAMPYLGYGQEPHGDQNGSSVARNQFAPPSWEIAVVATPIVTALFICASRYADFHHAGIDILAGAIIGTIIGWASFRMYHMPVRRSAGLSAWGPRPGTHALAAPIVAGTAGKQPTTHQEAQLGNIYALRDLDSSGRQSTTQRSRTYNSEDAILRA